MSSQNCLAVLRSAKRVCADLKILRSAGNGCDVRTLKMLVSVYQYRGEHLQQCIFCRSFLRQDVVFAFVKKNQI